MSAPITPAAVPVAHLTLTGPNAGTPWCGISRAEAVERGDHFLHLPYSKMSYDLEQRLCPHCRREWYLQRAISALQGLRDECALDYDPCSVESYAEAKDTALGVLDDYDRWEKE